MRNSLQKLYYLNNTIRPVPSRDNPSMPFGAKPHGAQGFKCANKVPYASILLGTEPSIYKHNIIEQNPWWSDLKIDQNGVFMLKTNGFAPLPQRGTGQRTMFWLPELLCPFGAKPHGAEGTGQLVTQRSRVKTW